MSEVNNSGAELPAAMNVAPATSGVKFSAGKMNTTIVVMYVKTSPPFEVKKITKTNEKKQPPF